MQMPDTSKDIPISASRYEYVSTVALITIGHMALWNLIGIIVGLSIILLIDLPLNWKYVSIFMSVNLLLTVAPPVICYKRYVKLNAAHAG